MQRARPHPPQPPRERRPGSSHRERLQAPPRPAARPCHRGARRHGKGHRRATGQQRAPRWRLPAPCLRQQPGQWHQPQRGETATRRGPGPRGAPGAATGSG
eukprot:11684406-Alexandrium_andersonii.AAC.1